MYNQVDRINQQIHELERLKSNFQAMPTNIINVGSQTDFKAQYITQKDNVDEILVNCRTAFICLENSELIIKETNGDTIRYEIVKPKTPEQLKIEELERRISEYESRLNTTNCQVEQSETNASEHDESATKRTSKSISKQSE